jgi:hypothetical protein
MTQGKVAIVWRGKPENRGTSLATVPRLVPVGEALAARGFAVAPVVYCEEASAAVRADLAACAGVLVWVDPLTEGRDRSDLDAILRDAAISGVWVSAHPDTILKIGTKEVLHSTRELGWGGDTALYRTAADFARGFPLKLAASGVRVLKQHRGNGGQGVWKVTALEGSRLRLQEATHRDGTAIEMTLREFLDHCGQYFAGEGRLIDQAYQPRIVEGMVRCYMSGGTLVGFARQFAPQTGDVFGLPAAKTMLPPDEAAFQGLRASLEREWTPAMQRLLAISDGALPALWDADFLFGPKTADGSDSFVLCEINASCVTPFPPATPGAIAEAVQRALA